MQVSDFVKLVKPVLEWNMLIVGPLLVLGNPNDPCVISTPCSGHEMVYVII